uniref:Uncharacterized protein n=1 Tax=Yersinia pestis Java 9 TaxID=880632 RepID=E8PSB4_YERPE|nr:hypothetical protein YPJ_pPCP16 [Yersinia pestis Java 9]
MGIAAVTPMLLEVVCSLCRIIHIRLKLLFFFNMQLEVH